MRQRQGERNLVQIYLEMTQTEREKPGKKLFRDDANRERENWYKII